MTNVLAGAREWASHGFRVFPVGIVEGRKVPLTPNGFKDATTDVDQIASWFKPDVSFIGVVHDRVLILDFDGEEGWDTYEYNLYRLPEPLAKVRTYSGGLHLYYPPDPTVTKRQIRALPAMDILAGDGGYFIAPPSQGYQWINGSIAEVADGLR